jgi:hypothetical protein
MASAIASDTFQVKEIFSAVESVCEDSPALVRLKTLNGFLPSSDGSVECVMVRILLASAKPAVLYMCITLPASPEHHGPRNDITVRMDQIDICLVGSTS